MRVMGTDKTQMSVVVGNTFILAIDRYRMEVALAKGISPLSRAATARLLIERGLHELRSETVPTTLATPVTPA